VTNADLSNIKLTDINIRDAVFHDVNMHNACIIDANLSGCQIQDANLSEAIIDHVHLFGTTIRNVVLPAESEGGNETANRTYAPIRFHNCDLSGMELTNCRLAHADIRDCDLTGLRINGVLIEDLFYSCHGKHRFVACRRSFRVCIRIENYPKIEPFHKVFHVRFFGTSAVKMATTINYLTLQKVRVTQMVAVFHSRMGAL